MGNSRQIARIALVGAMVFVSTLMAQTFPAFQDRFECSNDNEIGKTGSYGWTALTSDAWTSQLDQEAYQVDVRGVASKGLSLSGASFGAPLDAYENMLVTGSPLWQNTSIQADVFPYNRNASGLVLRYANVASYYVCSLVGEGGTQPLCAGGAGVASAGRLAIHRVDAADTCSDAYVLAQTAVEPTLGESHQIVFAVEGGSLTCALTRGGSTISLAAVDPSPLPAGKSGLISWGSGGGVNDDPTLFDNVGIFVNDPDADEDGVSDAVEAVVGTDPNNPDTDGDTILDSEELLDHGNPADSDGDGTIDALDTDSDDDGISDAQEAGDNRLDTRAADVDCNGIADFRQPGNQGSPVSPDDCDGDGLTDEEELELGTQLCNPDSDGDGLDDASEVRLGTDPLVADVKLGGGGCATAHVHQSRALALLCLVLGVALGYSERVRRQPD